MRQGGFQVLQAGLAHLTERQTSTPGGGRIAADAGAEHSADRLHPYARFAQLAVRVVPEATRPEARRAATARSTPDFLKSIRFSRLGVDALEVECAAYVGMVGFLVAGLTAAFLARQFVGMDAVAFALYFALPIGGLALAVLQFLAKFPEIRSRSLRAKSAGQMPEAISYLALSMHLNPALTAAVAFAAEHTEEPIASDLRTVLWRVYMREHGRVEDAFLQFALEWGEWNEDFKKALYAIRAAELESTPDGLRATLENATGAMFQGARAAVEDFSLSLRAPTTVLFGVGILLPMMIGTMLPLASLGGASLPGWVIVLLLDVALPLGTLVYAYFILLQRPGSSPPPAIPIQATRGERAMTWTATAAAFVLPLGVGLAALRVPQLSLLGYLPFLWAATLPVGVYAALSTRRAKQARDLVRRLEREYPDALYQLGNRISEGHPVETAFAQTGATLQGTEVADVFRRITYRLQVTKASLEDALFGREGALRRQPSGVVYNTMKVVVGATHKDARTAGRTILSVSTYLREMLAVERDIRNRLKEVTDTMYSTGIVFAPVVMGVTVALNLIIANTVSGIDLGGGHEVFGFQLQSGGAGAALTPATFGLVIGVYLMFTLFVIAYFVTGIRESGDSVELRHMLGRAIPIGLTVYTLSFVVANLYLA